MKKIIFLILLVVAGWQIYVNQSVQVLTNADLILLDVPAGIIRTPLVVSSINYSCDGRQHCSQMTSCEEATYFIQNCPNTKMDGDYDGVPCERQHCN